MSSDAEFNLLANPWVIPCLILASGVVLGWIADRVARMWLLRWAATTAWKGDEVILQAVRGVTWLWVFLLGLHLAVRVAPLHGEVAASISRLVEVLVIISLTLTAARIATGALALYAERIAFRGSATVIPLLARIVLFIIGGLVILETEGVSIAPILTALGVGGLAVALALQDTLGNIFAGLSTLIAGQISPGDYIKLDADNEGWVIDIGWRNTSIRTMANNVVVVPNKRLAESIVTNYSKPEVNLALSVPVGVSYDADLPQVERILMELVAEMAAAHTGILADPPPAVRFVAFGESAIETRVSVRVRDIEAMYLMRHLLVMAIHARLRQTGINIAYPTRVVIMQPPAVIAEPDRATPT